MPPSTQKLKTRDRILDIAERLVQTRGFNAFSYADIAGALRDEGEPPLSLPTKAELGTQLIERYERVPRGARGDRPDERRCREKLRRYVDIYADVLRDNRMCLCGMLAAEFATLRSR